VTNVVLVRHGETVWHAENRYAGRTDVALSELGREQAERLAARLRDGGLAAIWASPLGRAAETAAAVVRATGLAPWSDERLRELDFGTAEGLTRDEMAERFPGALRAFDEDPVANHLPEGEDPRAAAARGVACLQDVAAAHPGARVLVVAHTTLVRLVLCQLLGVPLADYRRRFPFVRNCAISEVRLGGPRPALLEFNSPV
jgi:broad specificity phosphatase PhoE